MLCCFIVVGKVMFVEWNLEFECVRYSQLSSRFIAMRVSEGQYAFPCRSFQVPFKGWLGEENEVRTRHGSHVCLCLTILL